MIFGNDSMGEYNNRKFSIYQYPTCNDLHLSWMNDSASTVFLGGVLGDVFPSYKWTHLAVVYNNPIAKVYINGVFKTEYRGISNSSSFAYKTTLIYDNTSRYLCDVRLYNSALSQKEVHEIAQCLCCHYPLGNIDGKNIGRNLLKKSSMIGEKLVCDGTWYFNDVSSMTYDSNGFHLVTPTSGNQNNGVGFCFNDFSKLGIKKGDTITFSFDIKGTSDSNLPFTDIHLQNNGTTWYDTGHLESNPSKFNISSDFKRVFVTYTLPTDVEYKSKKMWLAVHGNHQSDLYIKNLKLEKSSVPTVWIPSAEDFPELYDDYIYDTSGFNNHLSTIGSVACEGNSPRYIYCTDFNQDGYFKKENLNISFSAFTIAFWIKIPKEITGQHFAFGTFSNFTNNGVGVWRDKENDYGYNAIMKSNAESSYGWFSGGIVEANKWTHVCYVYTGTEIKTYKNGSVVSKTTYGNNGVCYMPNIYLGNSTFNGCPASETDESSMSDFRLYATALSDLDILSLYNAPISITSQGALILKGELVEK